MFRIALPSACFLAATLLPQVALAVRSAELYTSESYGYGRVEARVRFAPGDGVVSSFFLWKDGSEKAGVFWNELDFEKLGLDCHLETNAFYGKPGAVHSQRHTPSADLCGAFHTYTYEWTPDSIAWFLDGVELRRETGATAAAYAENASTPGMQIRFNVWPGDASFGGNFSPSILPVHEYVDWVQFSSYADGAFTLQWRDDFDTDTLASRWLTGSWGSPKNLSTHDAQNVNIVDGYAVLSLTTDDAVGPGGAMPQGGVGGAPGGNSAGMGGSMSAPKSSDGGGCRFGAARTSRPSALLFTLGLAALGRLAQRRRAAKRRLTSTR
ncbi:MAG: family 16 glycosylhydrolase [Myxococcota bacterium]